MYALSTMAVSAGISGLNQILYCTWLFVKLAEHQFRNIEAGMASGSLSMY